MQYDSGQATAILICIEIVSWEGDVEDIREEGPDSAMLAPSTSSKIGREMELQRTRGAGAVRGVG